MNELLEFAGRSHMDHGPIATLMAARAYAHHVGAPCKAGTHASRSQRSGVNGEKSDQEKPLKPGKNRGSGRVEGAEPHQHLVQAQVPVPHQQHQSPNPTSGLRPRASIFSARCFRRSRPQEAPTPPTGTQGQTSLNSCP